MAKQDRRFDEIARTIEGIRVGMMTTADDDGTLQSRPMSVLRDRATIDALCSAAAKPWFPAGKDDPSLVALRVRATSIGYWDASSSRMLRMLEMARAAVTGTRADPGEHGRIERRR